MLAHILLCHDITSISHFLRNLLRFIWQDIVLSVQTKSNSKIFDKKKTICKKKKGSPKQDEFSSTHAVTPPTKRRMGGFLSALISGCKIDVGTGQSLSPNEADLNSMPLAN